MGIDTLILTLVRMVVLPDLICYLRTTLMDEDMAVLPFAYNNLEW